MDTGVTVFWPGLNLLGALTSAARQREKARPDEKQQTSRQVESPNGDFLVSVLFTIKAPGHC